MSEPKVWKAGQWREITPQMAGWSYVGFTVVKLAKGASLRFEADGEERAIVPLAGTVDAETDTGGHRFGGRASVFDGLGSCLYVPRDTAITISAVDDIEIAVASAPAETKHEVVLVSPDSLSIESRGGGNASRQVSTLMPPDFPADRLLVVEVWTPGGNWSSYPPHKHEANREGEAELEETYYYRLRDREKGWALQRAYQPDRNFDLVETVRDGDICTLPWAYHTTVAAHGHDLYYLNVLAGPAAARTLQAYQDPFLAHLADAWEATGIDERVPFVPRFPEAADPNTGRDEQGDQSNDAD